jgi:hypothetical protein
MNSTLSFCLPFSVFAVQQNIVIPVFSSFEELSCVLILHWH